MKVVHFRSSSRARRNRWIETPKLETLERRQFLSATQINYADFSSTAGLNTTGYGSAATTSGTSLVLTDGAANESRGVLFNQAVPIDSFTDYFAYHATDAQVGAGSGFSIVMDGASSNGTPNGNSVVVNFTFNNTASTYSIVQNGAASSTTLASNGTVDLHDGGTWYTALTYDGSQLSVSLRNYSITGDEQAYDRFSVPIDLASALGGNQAIAGFSATTGSNDTANQSLDKWTFSGSDVLTITSAPATASANNVVAGTSTTMSVGAVDTANNPMTYDWSVSSIPNGAAMPTFSLNNSSSAASPTIKFHKDGTYQLAVTVSDGDGNSATQNVDVVVQQVATSLRITPHSAVVHRGKHQQYAVMVLDQFGHALRSQPDVSWSIIHGTGSIHSDGLFTAGQKKGHYIVQVTVDDLTGTVSGAIG
ncbi:MAG: PKD domain-containing protein [Phycisphaerae bacterium]|nr:PKD domain-containing protein [Phycisphaerae bacterium]